MRTTDLLLSYQGPEPTHQGFAQAEIAFLFAKTPQQLNLHWLSQHPDLLNFLVANIAKQPKNLITHIQRICLCYQKNLSDHLYGAMVDLFCVLNGYAEDFSGRLLDKVLPKLNASHAYLLNQYLHDKDIVTLFMVQNSYTVLGKGLLGSSQIITKLSDTEVNEQKTQDALQLARDYIEYSQFQEAKMVLESAVLESSARKELHEDLLELYKSLQDVNGFLTTKTQLAESQNPFSELWDELEDYFKTRNML